jgi:uncharacterized protein YndB with AHSA1/START domain
MKPLEQEVWINAPRDTVFDYLTDNELLVRWMGGHAELDAVTGGQYLVKFKEGWVSRGEFVEVRRPERIVYTVGWEGHDTFPPGSTRVEITLSAERGGTRLLLRHYGPPPEGLEHKGWGEFLERLLAAATHQPVPDDPFDSLIERATETEPRP